MASYPLNPPLECDVITKGGITSGVIYPGAVCELAKAYRLRSIGGASAGAIAAAAAAAAECGRATGGFELLEQLPHDLTAPTAVGGSRLARLFQPTASTAGLFAVATSAMGRSGAARILAPLGAITRHFPLQALAGGLPGAVVAALGLAGSGLASGTAIVAGALMFIVARCLAAWQGSLGRPRRCRAKASGCARECRGQQRPAGQQRSLRGCTNCCRSWRAAVPTRLPSPSVTSMRRAVTCG